MRKIITSVLVLSALGACSSIPSEEERGEELYLRLRYLRAAFETAYADHSSATLDTVSREIKSYARNDLNLFVQDLRNGALWKKEIAAFVLGFSTNKKAQAGLIQATRDPDLNVRGIALASLGFMRMADTPLEVFRKNLNSAHWYLRQAALYGLRYQLNAGETGGMVSAVLKRLRDSQMDVRNEALIVLRRMKSKETLSSIITISLKDDHPHVRQSAAITLSVFGEEGEEAIPSLVEALRDADTKVVEAAWVALRQITGNEFDRTYERWRDWYTLEEAKYEYICPQHLESSFDSPGQCPKCLATLSRTLRPEIFLCLEHPDIQSATQGRCSICSRKLVAFRPSYHCPIHPGSESSLTGECPTCGKDRIPIKKEYSCPTHLDVEAPRTGKCSRCEKELAPVQK
jgi:hypothetical protein